MASKKHSMRVSHYDNLKPSLLTDLKDALIRHEYYKGNLFESHKGVLNMFEIIYEILGEDDEVSTRIRSDMEEEMMPIKHLIRDPVILVSGQVNSGKSSLINEILETSLVPVEDLPCTTRIVRIKYSEESYYQLFDKSEKPKGERRPYGRKMEKENLKQEIKLRSSGCFDEIAADFGSEEIVEIGIKSDLLKSGIQIYDTPGMSENETLDRIVQECLDGVLQVLIYVIDANPCSREVDDKFIHHIKNKAPWMTILYVCNKCEDDTMARSLDTASDDEGSDDDETDGGPVQHEREKSSTKGEAVFRKLKLKGQIKDDEDIKTCDHFFQVSCREIRQARHGSSICAENNTYVAEFHRLITSMICHFQDCVNEHMVNSVSKLYALATKTFDFFVSGKFLSQRVWSTFRNKMKLTEKIEEDVVKKIREFIDDHKTHLYDSIKMIVDDRKEYIVKKGGELILDSQSSSKGKTWTSECTKNYRLMLTESLLNTLSEEIFSKGVVCGLLETITKMIQNNIRELLADCDSLDGVGDLLPQLESCYNIILTPPASRSFSKHLVRKAFNTRILHAFEQFKFKVFHAPSHEELESWQRETTKDLLENLDIKELGNMICDQLSSQVNDAHQRFLEILENIEIMHKSRRLEQGRLLTWIPEFSLMICKLRALKGEITFGKNYVEISDLVADTRGRSLVFHCKYGGNKAAARRVRQCYDEALSGKFAELINYTRLLHLNHRNVLKVLDVYCDKFGVIHAVVPFMDSSLFQMLCSTVDAVFTPLKDRIVIAHSIVQACEFLGERGFRVTDLRPNNVLMNNGIPVLNLLKWKALEAPYPSPDEKPPFHWAPEVILNMEAQSPKRYDTYSCTILLWWLAAGLFVRPRFAETTDINKINATVVRCMEKVLAAIIHSLDTSVGQQTPSLQDKTMLHGVRIILRRNIKETPSDRMSLGELEKALKRVLSGGMLEANGETGTM